MRLLIALSNQGVSFCFILYLPYHNCRVTGALLVVWDMRPVQVTLVTLTFQYQYTIH